uniref:CALR n=1 Tax=Castor canadensis TaxID=51338 RepID=A0A8C0ZRP1_CASCN
LNYGHMPPWLAYFLPSLAVTESPVYFKEQFLDGDDWTSRWIESKHKSDLGKFILSSGKFYGDQKKDKGLQTSQDVGFYALLPRSEPFSNKSQMLVVQFTMKHEQNTDCGGGYVKLFPSLDQKDIQVGSGSLRKIGTSCPSKR